MANNARDSIESYARMTSFNEFETHTREVVMDFMGLVPITCPPSLISFQPFKGAEGSPYSDEVFQQDVTDGRKVKSFRISSDHSKHRTIIRKCGKLVILEEDDDEEMRTKQVAKSSKKLKLSKFFFNLARFVKPTGMSSSHSHRDVQNLVSPDSNKKSFNKSWTKMLRKKSTDTITSTNKSSTNNGTNGSDTVDSSNQPELSINKVPFNWNFPPSQQPHPPSAINNTASLKKTDTFKSETSKKPLQKFQSILRRKSKKVDMKLRVKKESVYVDVGDMDDIDGMVDKKHLSPAALPLQRELQGLRTRPGTPVFSPTTEVANSLRAIADQVEEDYSAELSRAVGRLVNYEETCKLGYEELKVVAMEILKDVAPGWSQVAVPLLLSQMVAMSLLGLGNRSVVSRLVDFTTRFICGSLDSFVLEQGGWSSVRRMRVNEVAIENSVLSGADDYDRETEL